MDQPVIIIDNLFEPIPMAEQIHQFELMRQANHDLICQMFAIQPSIPKLDPNFGQRMIGWDG